jgi:chorismate mutase
MRSAIRHQLSRLDQSLLALANERARLLATVTAEDRARGAAVSDLLRRNQGPLSAGGVRALFQTLDRACEEVSRGSAPFRPQDDGEDAR